MKLWIDGVRPAPYGYRKVRSVNEAKETIKTYEIMRRVSGGKRYYIIELVDIDHGEGDYIKLLDWLEETGRNYPIRIHSMNPDEFMEVK